MYQVHITELKTGDIVYTETDNYNRNPGHCLRLNDKLFIYWSDDKIDCLTVPNYVDSRDPTFYTSNASNENTVQAGIVRWENRHTGKTQTGKMVGDDVMVPHRSTNGLRIAIIDEGV